MFNSVACRPPWMITLLPGRRLDLMVSSKNTNPWHGELNFRTATKIPLRRLISPCGLAGWLPVSSASAGKPAVFTDTAGGFSLGLTEALNLSNYVLNFSSVTSWSDSWLSSSSDSEDSGGASAFTFLGLATCSVSSSRGL